MEKLGIIYKLLELTEKWNRAIWSIFELVENVYCELSATINTI